MSEAPNERFDQTNASQSGGGGVHFGLPGGLIQNVFRLFNFKKEGVGGLSRKFESNFMKLVASASIQGRRLDKKVEETHSACLFNL